MKKKGKAPTPVTRPVRAAAVSACNIECRSYTRGGRGMLGPVVTAYLALGSNLGDRRAFLYAAAGSHRSSGGVRLVAKAASMKRFPKETPPSLST